MGEKGNLLDMGEEIFENLAEQGPQFWLDYEQYKQARIRGAQAPVAVGEAGAPDLAAERPSYPATG
jgi:hypothetical protein